jgi:hypothetical protein
MDPNIPASNLCEKFNAQNQVWIAARKFLVANKTLKNKGLCFDYNNIGSNISDNFKVHFIFHLNNWAQKWTFNLIFNHIKDNKHTKHRIKHKHLLIDVSYVCQSLLLFQEIVYLEIKFKQKRSLCMLRNYKWD